MSERKVMNVEQKELRGYTFNVTFTHSGHPQAVNCRYNFNPKTRVITETHTVQASTQQEARATMEALRLICDCGHDYTRTIKQQRVKK